LILLFERHDNTTCHYSTYYPTRRTDLGKQVAVAEKFLADLKAQQEAAALAEAARVEAARGFQTYDEAL